MEALTAIVVKAIQEGVLSSYTGISAMQRLSIYADDVVLFVRPTIPDLRFVKEALHIFGIASGMNINYSKSTTIMIRDEDGDKELVAGAMPWSMDSFPCKYLGLQLSIWQLTRSEWQPVVDSVLNFMLGWQKGLITRAGRLVLVHDVVMARPTHHLIIAEAPKWAIEQVNK